MYVICNVYTDSVAPEHARTRTRTQARGATPDARRQSSGVSQRHHIPWLVRRQAFHTDYHAIGSPSLCVIDQREGGGGGTIIIYNNNYYYYK